MPHHHSHSYFGFERRRLRHSYSYLERRYRKKTRLQVFLLVTGLTAALVGGLVALQMSETDAERFARAERQYSPEQSLDRASVSRRQDYNLRLACDLGPEACAEAKEEIRKQNCQLYREGCKSSGPNRRPASFDDELDRIIRERMRNAP
jgi:hypothetical protein